jgi:Catalase
MNLRLRAVLVASVPLLAFAAACGGEGEENNSESSDVTASSTPPLNEEASSAQQAGEATLFTRFAKDINDLQTKNTAVNGGVTRGFHVKPHACALGEFQVDTNAPVETRFGVLANPGAKFSAWVRLSNAQTTKQSDRTPDIRGLAIKLLNVPGAKLMPGQETATTQDFLSVNSPTLGARNATDFMDFQKAVASSKAAGVAFLAAHPVMAKALLDVTSHQIASMFTERYWSGVPYKLGTRAIKFSFTPCKTLDRSSQMFVADSYLREDAHATIKSGDACFDFSVQFQKDPVKQPVEDSSALWDEKLAPFVHVARLVIPTHDLDSDMGKREEAYCEKLAWNPWHALPEHRPIGNANRARKIVMEAAQKFRNAAKPVKEPVGVESF